MTLRCGGPSGLDGGHALGLRVIRDRFTARLTARLTGPQLHQLSSAWDSILR